MAGVIIALNEMPCASCVLIMQLEINEVQNTIRHQQFSVHKKSIRGVQGDYYLKQFSHYK